MLSQSPRDKEINVAAPLPLPSVHLGSRFEKGMAPCNAEDVGEPPLVSSFKLTLVSLWALVAPYIVHRSDFLMFPHYLKLFSRNFYTDLETA